ncbi:MAG TPA: hypothetical protein VGO62_20850 [Myxococcota bacterium]
MTGFEILVVLGGLFGCAASALVAAALLSERGKRRFVALVQRDLEGGVSHVVSGDIARPLSFMLGAIHVHAMVRGDVEVWQLERREGGAAPTLAMVYRGWRAPDTRELAPMGDVTAQLELLGDDEPCAKRLLARGRAEIARVLGRDTRRCIVGGGRAFLEVTRRGLRVAELAEALVRLDAIVDVVAGRTATRVLAGAADHERALAAIDGAPIAVPGLTLARV